MDTYNILRRLLTERGYLAIDPDNETCRLIGTSEAKRLVLEKEAGEHAMTTVFPIFRGLPTFMAAVGEEDRSFSVSEVAQLVGVGRNVIDQYVRLNVINIEGEPEFGQQRRISYLDAFIAAVQGTLRRFGSSLPTLRRAADAIREAYRELKPAEEVEASSVLQAEKSEAQPALTG